MVGVETAPGCPAESLPAADLGQRITAALQTAARTGDASVLAALLRDPCGARYIDATDAEGRTALHFAAAGGRDNAACALLLVGADAEAADRQRQTPLHAAAASCNACVVQLLLNHGADATKVDARGRLPLHIAAEACSGGPAPAAWQTVAVLARRCPATLQQRALDGDTPVHVVCRGQSWRALGALRGLQQAGLLCAQVLTCGNKDGRTPLALAALSGEAGTAAYLLPLCPAAAISGSCAACQAACACTPADSEEAAQGDARWGSALAVAASCAGHACALAAAAASRDYTLMLRIVGSCGATAAGLSCHVLGAAVADHRADVAAALLAAGLRCSPYRPLCKAVEAGDAAALRSLLRAGEDTVKWY